MTRAASHQGLNFYVAEAVFAEPDNTMRFAKAAHTGVPVSRTPISAGMIERYPRRVPGPRLTTPSVADATPVA